MADKRRIDKPTGTETVGHEWDGIEELDTPMPRWWLWSFYASIVFAVGYVFVYPAIPFLNDNSKGALGWTARGELNKVLENEAAKRAPIVTAIAATPIDELVANPQLRAAATQGGSAAFKVYCVQCHGSGAAGSRGYPNLIDDDWLWGGDPKSIEYSITHGIRSPGEEQTRSSLMPAFGKDGILTATQVQDVVSHVRVISGQEKASASAQRGAALFTDNCAVCHAGDGKGLRAFGAPDLTDAIWLFGGDRAALTQSVNESRKGVMPAWGTTLDEATIRMLAVYVHGLGGGEASAPAQVARAAEGEANATP